MRISDEELRRRLKERSYPVPPITDSTRHVLLKKLQQLETEDEKKKNNEDEEDDDLIRGRKHQLRRKPLFDYSSAEDEEILTNNNGNSKNNSSSAASAAVKKKSTRRIIVNNTTTSNVTPNGRTSGSKKRVINGYNSKDRVKSLLSHSEEEESEDEESEDHHHHLYNKHVQVDDEEEESEESEDEDDEEEDRSPPSPTTASSSIGSPTFRRLQTTSSNNNRDRFASSTPLNTIRSTASYLEGDSPRLKPEFSPLSSPTLRKQIASNKESFGSLGEALSSLPQSSSSGSSTSLPNTRPLLFSNGCGTNSSILTQAPAPLSHMQKEFKTKRSSFCNSHSISKIIVVLAGIFFSGIAFKYSHLRPNPNIMNRIVICERPSFPENCVNGKDAEAFIQLHKEVVNILEKKGVEILCGPFSTSSGTPIPSIGANATFSYPVDDLFNHCKSTLENGELDRSLFSRFIDLLHQNPQWGLLVSSNQSEISLYNPPIDWSCWLSLKIGLTYSFLLSVMSWILKGFILLGVGYGLYRWRLWYQERKLRENQDVFELVEHVLSILATQNTLVLREGRGSTSSPCIAINHIRDQLISPQDRDKKRKLWDKVVNYIRKSESRVREGTQKIYGEEVEVWQWIPDIRWGNSSLNQHGPNPYVPGVAATTNQPPPASSPHLTPPSPQWQGSAFSSLNKNVAAPQVAPTTCLKVRHMFDRTVIQNSPTRWVWQVKEEILRRCAGSATILHIAVDKQSSEGCVYIKTSNTDGAGAVFRCLHSQWYRGNLVTVKYLREERYLERFPDSRLARTPLLPTTMQAN